MVMRHVIVVVRVRHGRVLMGVRLIAHYLLPRIAAGAWCGSSIRHGGLVCGIWLGLHLILLGWNPRNWVERLLVADSVPPVPSTSYSTVAYAKGSTNPASAKPFSRSGQLSQRPHARSPPPSHL